MQYGNQPWPKPTPPGLAKPDPDRGWVKCGRKSFGTNDDLDTIISHLSATEKVWCIHVYADREKERDTDDERKQESEGSASKSGKNSK